VYYQLLTALPNCWRSRRSWVHQIGMVVLVADGVALLGLLLAPRPRMGGGSHRCSERAREGLAQFIGVPRGLCFISKPPGSKKKTRGFCSCQGAASPFRGKVEKKGGEFGVRSAAKTSCSGVFGPTSALPSPVRSQALPRAKGDPHLLVSELGKTFMNCGPAFCQQPSALMSATWPYNQHTSVACADVLVG
jgi:hypothetical protein